MYLNEINSKNKGGQPVGLAWFTKQFHKTLRDGVTDSETGVRYQTYIMKSSAKGFSACNFCKYIQMRMSGSSNLAKRSAYQRKFQKHIDEVYADREELARIQRLCMVNPHHCGFFIDAADSNKFQLPTTKSTAKLLSQLWRIKQKMTCVQIFDAHKSLYFFRTLPDVPTGGNLTCTILAEMLTTGLFCKCTDLYINVDGAGDNICYTLIYALVHFLLSANSNKWNLKRIHVLRMKVGHTHNDLDATFGVLSRYVYGKHSRGDSRKDILSFKAFEEVRCLFVSH